MTPPDAKWFIVTSPVAIVDDGSWTTNEIDTIGYEYLEVAVTLGAVDIALTVLKLQDSDATGTDFGDVTGCVFGTSVNSTGSASTLPAADDDNKVFLFNVSLIGRKRFFDLVATIDDGTTGGFMSCVARLSRAETGPNAAAEYGASQVLQVPAFVD